MAAQPQSLPWSEMDFVTVLAGAYPHYAGIRHLEADAQLGRHFAVCGHSNAAAFHAMEAGDAALAAPVRRELALRAVAYLAAIVDRIDQEAAR